jgi:uncharacterized protein (TIGR02145 family)
MGKSFFKFDKLISTFLILFSLFAFNSCNKEDNNNQSTTSVTNCGLLTKVTDIDGNEYKTVKIGEQFWMTENLRTKRYSNGDTIQNINNPNQSIDINSGYWIHYNNDSQFENPYGKLYNWYAVVDERGLCPTGWHTPNDDEWTQLELTLGVTEIEASEITVGWRGESENVGGKMKATELWQSPNSGANNLSCFSGLPGGYFSENFTFSNHGLAGDWWSSSEESSMYAVAHRLDYTNSGCFRFPSISKSNGLSIRCVKD